MSSFLHKILVVVIAFSVFRVAADYMPWQLRRGIVCSAQRIYGTGIEALDVRGSDHEPEGDYVSSGIRTCYREIVEFEGMPLADALGLPAIPQAYWHGASTAVPEPTGAALALAGLTLLALRRKGAWRGK